MQFEQLVLMAVTAKYLANSIQNFIKVTIKKYIIINSIKKAIAYNFSHILYHILYIKCLFTKYLLNRSVLS